MILVDTSVWIRHSQRPNRVLSEYLETPEILMHPMVLGELACGMFSRRDSRFRVWQALPRAPLHDHDDVIDGPGSRVHQRPPAVLDAATAWNPFVDARQEPGALGRRIRRGASAKQLIPPTHQRDG